MIQFTCGLQDISHVYHMAQVLATLNPSKCWKPLRSNHPHCSMLAASPVRGRCWRSVHGPRPKQWHLVPPVAGVESGGSCTVSQMFVPRISFQHDYSQAPRGFHLKLGNWASAECHKFWAQSGSQKNIQNEDLQKLVMEILLFWPTSVILGSQLLKWCLTKH